MAVGLGSLEIELLSLIFEFVIDSSPSTAKAVAVVNKNFYSTFKLVGHRFKTIDYSVVRGKRGKQTDLKPWLEDEELLRGVRHISVKSHYAQHRSHHDDDGQTREALEAAKFDDLIVLISRLGSLKKLVWSSSDPIPAAVLAALHEHQKKAELRVYDWSRWDSTADHTDPSEAALAKSPALTLIRAQIWNYGAGNHPDLREVAFKRIVASAPKLRNASVITGHSGCVVSFPSPEQVEEIEEMSKLFHAHKEPNSALRSLTLDGYGLTEGTLQSWSKFVNLSQLNSLKCSRGVPSVSYFNYASTFLSSLKHVSLNLAHNVLEDSMKQAVETYITTCAPLDTLSLWSWHGIIPLSSILDAHGPTLRSLQLHERETTGQYGQSMRTLLTANEVKQIMASCPNLKDFSFDLDRHTCTLETELDEDADIFNIVADVHLNKLQIYYDLGIASLNGPYGSMHRPMIMSDSDEDEDEQEDGDDHNDNDESVELDTAPPKKKAKIKVIPKPPPKPLSPTPNPQLSAFATKVWKKVFGSTGAGSRALDLKFGEWERKMGSGYPAPWVIEEQRLKTHWMIRPKERDDQQDECDVKHDGEGYELQVPSSQVD